MEILTTLPKVVRIQILSPRWSVTQPSLTPLVQSGEDGSISTFVFRGMRGSTTLSTPGAEQIRVRGRTRGMTFLDHAVSDVLIVRRPSGTDTVSFTIDGPTPFPEMAAEDPKGNYSPHLNIEVRRGYAEQWLALMGVTEFRLIQA